MIVLPLGYLLDADEHNVVLCRDSKQVDKKTGKVKRDSVGWYKDIPQALEGWYQHAQRDLVGRKDEMELKEAIAAARALHDEAMRAIRRATSVDGRVVAGQPATPLLPAQTTPSKGTHENAL